MNHKVQSFPRYHPNKSKEKAGLRAVATVIEDGFGWSFRETDLADDYGVDAFADCVVDGNVTGKCLALQIKCGDSHFTARGEDGFYFVGEMKHLNYYGNMAMPVIIVVCDASAKHAWWFRFDHEAIEPAGQHWKMFVPWAQKFDAHLKAAWLSIAGPAWDYFDETQLKWAVDSMLRRHQLIWLMVDRRDIERLDVSFYKRLFDRFVKNRSLRMDLRGKVMFTVYGYDDDPRELWEIPEVRAWMAIAEPEIKYWLWFMSLDPKVDSMRLLQYCVSLVHRKNVKPEIGDLALHIDVKDRRMFLDRHFGWLNELCAQFSIPEKINREVSARFGQYLESRLIDETGARIR